MPERPLDPTVVIDRVAEWYRVEPSAMRQSSRRVHIVRARRVAVIMVSLLSGCSLRVAAQSVGYSVGDSGSFVRLKTWVDETQLNLADVEAFVREAS